MNTRVEVEKKVAYEQGVTDRENEWQKAAALIKQAQKDEVRSKIQYLYLYINAYKCIYIYMSISRIIVFILSLVFMDVKSVSTLDLCSMSHLAKLKSSINSIYIFIYIYTCPPTKCKRGRYQVSQRVCVYVGGQARTRFPRSLACVRGKMRAPTSPSKRRIKHGISRKDGIV